ncbi:MAG: hypothetical protein IJ494_00865 [Bacteroides sp.]|nr:hypothetical protein [Bacteroides sp.]
MAKLSYKLSYYVLYAMFAAIIAVIILFFAGGNATGDEVLASVDPDMWQPAQTNALLYLTYALFVLAVVVTIIGVAYQFVAALKDNPAAAVKSLAGVLVLVAVVVISWVMGSDQPLNILGYEGAHNVPFWLKLADMLIYSTYILLAGVVLAMLAGVIRKKLL